MAGGMSGGIAENLPRVEEADLPPPPNRSERQKREDQMWHVRIEQSARVRDELVAAGDEVLRYVRGEDVTFEKFKNLDLKWNLKVTLPLLKTLVDSLVPAVMARDPSVSVVPSDNTDEVTVRRAQNSSLLLEKSNREHNLKFHSRMAVKEALMYPLSVMETDFSDERGLPRATWHSIKNALWDIHGNGLPETLRWAAIEYELPIDAARKEFNAPWLRPDSSSVDFGTTEREQRDFFDRFNNLDEDRVLDQKRIIRIWVRGDVPFLDDANIQDKDNKSEAGKSKEFAFDGENRLIFFDPNTNRILRKRNWPFVLDHTQLPVHFLVPEMFPGSLASISTFEPLIHIQDLLNWLHSFIAEGVRNSVQVQGFYDPEEIDDDIIEQLRNPKDRNFIAWSGMEQKRDITKIIQRFELGGLNQETLQGLAIFDAAFNRVSGETDLTAAATARIQKTGVAQITQARSDNRIALLADQIEDWMTNIQRSMLQIALSIMTGPEVALWIGEENLGRQEIVQLPDGTTQINILQFWPELDIDVGADVRAIRADSDAVIEPGSMRKQSPEEQINNETLLFDRNIASMANLAAEMRLDRKRFTLEALFRIHNGHNLRIGELNNNLKTDRYVIDPERDVEDIPPSPEDILAQQQAIGNQQQMEQQDESAQIQELLAAQGA